MKKYIILFKIISIPFASNKIEEFNSEWAEYIKTLEQSNRLIDYSFFKNATTKISKQTQEQNKYVPRKELINGYILIKASNLREAIDLSSNNPIFIRNGELHIRELDGNHLNYS